MGFGKSRSFGKALLIAAYIPIQENSNNYSRYFPFAVDLDPSNPSSLDKVSRS
jgi:hypothetical protein